MQTIAEPRAFQTLCAQWRAEGRKLALVPTMGYFHAGHESLMRKGRELVGPEGVLIVSLFVNPSQFAPTEDLAAYPRDLPKDSAIAAANGADVLFAPESDAMYPKGYGTWVEVPELAKVLCGQTRPTHFRGVCTVVLQLFNLARPHFAVFGEKDRQQLTIIRRMTADLHLEVEVVGAPIVREADGLAMSSRNKYLTEAERAQAPEFNKGLRQGVKLAAEGEREAAAIFAAIRAYWQKNFPGLREDYLTIVDAATLADIPRLDRPAVLAAAIYLGKARLIDNLLLQP